MPQTPRLDATDRRIIRALQRNGRMTNLDLADEVGLSPSPCSRRVQKLEEGSSAKTEKQWSRVAPTGERARGDSRK